MATAATAPIATINSIGEITSIKFSGTSNECINLRLFVNDSSGTPLFVSPVDFIGTSWSKLFTVVNNDFLATDISCNQELNLKLICYDDAPHRTLFDDKLRVHCEEMECALTIDSVLAIPSSIIGSGLQQLEIKGSANCPSVNVDVALRIGGIVRSSISQVVTVDAVGKWTATFIRTTGDTRLKEFNCKDEVRITVTCEDNKQCYKSEPKILECSPPVDKPCPDVNLTIIPGDCIDGRRSVKIRADVTSYDDATCVWYFGIDQDMTLGEDTAPGGWLSSADALGNRFVEVVHVYETDNSSPKTVTVKIIISSGPDSECETSKDFTLEPCTCNLQVSLNVLNNLGDLVPTNECFPPGDYIVEVSNPVGADPYLWSVDGSRDFSQTDSTFNFSIASEEEKYITVVVERGSCIVSNGLTIKGCKKGNEIPPPDDSIVSPPNDFTISLCGAAKALLMVGVSLSLVGVVLLLCPEFTFISASTVLAVTLIATGSGIFLLGLVMWLIFCNPGICDWLILSWQILFLSFAAFTYAAFCPACFYLIFGLVFLALSVVLFFTWKNRCNPSICKIFFELLFLISLGLNIVSALEYGLGWTGCLISANPVGMQIWMAGVIVLNTFVALGLSRNECLRES